MHTLSQMLSKEDVFQAMPLKEIDLLAECAVFRKLHRGEYVCHQGDHWPYALFLARGELRWAILSMSGREQVLYKVNNGQTDWEDRCYPPDL